MTPDMIAKTIEIAHREAAQAALLDDSPIRRSTALFESMAAYGLHSDYIRGVLECYWMKYRELKNAKLQA